ncbi:hypothetical protein R2R32_08720 [Clostridium perfringens]|nr:hypothetical protein [Clostridium perfringens]
MVYNKSMGWCGSGALLIARGIFEKVMANNQRNAKVSFLGGGAIILYVIARYFGIL